MESSCCRFKFSVALYGLLLFMHGAGVMAAGTPSADEVLGKGEQLDSVERGEASGSNQPQPEEMLVAAEPSSRQVALTVGVLGFGLEFSHALSEAVSIGAQLQYGSLISLRDFEEQAAYSLQATRRHLVLLGRYFPWGEGAYAQIGLSYSDHDGFGYWRAQPPVLEGINLPLEQTGFNYRFSPLAVAFGLGWQGQWLQVSDAARGNRPQRAFQLGLAFDLLVHGSADVTLSPEVVSALGWQDASQLRGALVDDLDEAKVLPNLALKFAYTF